MADRITASADTPSLLSQTGTATSLPVPFGPAVASAGITMVPAALVSYGSTGHGASRTVGVKVKPVGAFVISADGAAWLPIVGRRRIALGVIGVLGITAVVLIQLRKRATVASAKEPVNSSGV